MKKIKTSESQPSHPLLVSVKHNSQEYDTIITEA